MVEREFPILAAEDNAVATGRDLEWRTAIGPNDLRARPVGLRRPAWCPAALLRNSATRANSGALLIRRHWCRKTLLMPP
jgi:hypothetical protein